MSFDSLLIFDLDGTLFRADTVTVPAVQRGFAGIGLPAPSTDEVYGFIGRPPEEFHAWLSERVPATQAPALIESIDRGEIQLIGETGQLYPGIPQALTTLRSMVTAMAICTNGVASYVEPVVRLHGLDAFFDEVRHIRSPGDTKSGMVGELLARFGGGRTIVIGDRQHDIDAARDNGVLSIAAAYGYGPPEELAAANASALSPEDLPKIVSALLQDGRHWDRSTAIAAPLRPSRP
jgi:phosphoglycolate phosphatase